MEGRNRRGEWGVSNGIQKPSLFTFRLLTMDEAKLVKGTVNRRTYTIGKINAIRRKQGAANTCAYDGLASCAGERRRAGAPVSRRSLQFVFNGF